MIGSAEEAVQPLRLEDIGISEEILLNALLAGDGAAASCTRNHPPMAPGFYRFAETVRALADQLAPLGWTRSDYKNFSTVVRPDGMVAIAVASGDPGTGDMRTTVTTRSPKGVVTQEAVATNLKLPLDERYVVDNERIIESREAPEAATWFLLHDRREGTLYSELSFPQAIDADGYVRRWRPRIPLAPQQLDAVLLSAAPEPPLNPIVDVRRRDAI